MNVKVNTDRRLKLFQNLKHWLPSLIIFPIVVWLVMNRETYTWIDNADLVIHEAGHVIFMVFGKFIYTLGGTLMQIIIPTLLVWYFVVNRYLAGIQAGLLWLGQNLINISIYAADARAQKLPLLGGSKVYHDWAYILGSTNLLQYDSVVGNVIFGASVIIFILALLLPLYFQE